MTRLVESDRQALLRQACDLLRIAEPQRIVFDALAGSEAGLADGTPVRVIFEPPGVLRVFCKLSGQLLAESEPGRLERPARPSR